MIANLLIFAGCVLFMAPVIETLLDVSIVFYEVEGVKFLSRKKAERYARLIHEVRNQMVELYDIKKELEASE